MAVCLHCLHAARLEARERRQRAIMRVGVWTLIIAVIGVVGAAGANAVTRHPEPVVTTHAAKGAATRTVAARPDSLVVGASAPVLQQGAPAVATPPPTDSAAKVTPVPAATAVTVVNADSASTRPTASFAVGPVLPQGRTDLPDSLFATRSGDTVVVHFDTSPARTRRADKFESIVRRTLDAVYGPIADTTLAAVPEGHLVAPNELLTSLPSRGIHLAGPHGARLVIWPETRPGRDGPLIVAYRTIVER